MRGAVVAMRGALWARFPTQRMEASNPPVSEASCAEDRLTASGSNTQGRSGGLSGPSNAEDESVKSSSFESLLRKGQVDYSGSDTEGRSGGLSGPSNAKEDSVKSSSFETPCTRRRTARVTRCRAKSMRCCSAKTLGLRGERFCCKSSASALPFAASLGSALRVGCESWFCRRKPHLGQNS